MISKRGGLPPESGFSSLCSPVVWPGAGAGGASPHILFLVNLWESAPHGDRLLGGGLGAPRRGTQASVLSCQGRPPPTLPLPHRRVGDGLKASGGAWAFSCLPHGPCGGCRGCFPDAGTRQRLGRPVPGPRDGHDNGDGGAPVREAGSAEPQMVAAGPWGRPGRREVARRVALAQASRRCAQGRSQSRSRSGGQPCMEVGGEASSETGPSAEAGTGNRHHRGCVRSDPRAAPRGWPFSGPDGLRHSSLGALSGDCRHRLGP